ncbi:hypothetical protein N7507_004615 [Penicillium longicatenatum]|nr:hypothetical protein N7507_004615 [Penicillium longicatenatum]
MSLTDNIEVVLPPPSQELSKYKPFPPSFDAIVEEILSEEASFDHLGDEDWPVTSACPSEKSFTTLAEYVATPTSETKKPAAKSPYFSYLATSNNAEMAERTRPRTRAAARRSITVVDMASEGEEESTPTLEGHLDESSHVDGAMDENSTASKVVGPQNEAVGPKKDVIDPEHEGIDPAALQPPNNVNDADIELDDPEDEAEENVIFASVGQSKGDDIIQYVGTHQFFETPVQPVSRSARLQFTIDLRGVAVSAGMPDAAINGLLDYVRRIYLNAAGVSAGSPDSQHEITFGEEIDDTPTEISLPRRSRKRSLDQTDGSSSKKRKISKRRSSQDSNASVRPVVQVEDSQGINSTEFLLHTSPEELRQEMIGFTDVVDGPDQIPESPILAAQSPPKTQEQPRAVGDIIDLTCDSDKEPVASNTENSQDNEPLQKLSVAPDDSLVMSPPDMADKGNVLDESSLDPNDLNSLDLVDSEPNVEAESGKERETQRNRHGSKNNKRKNKKLSLLNPQNNPDSEPQSELPSTNVPFETSERKEERRRQKNRRKREKKRLNRKDKIPNLGINPDQRAVTPSRQITPAQAIAPSTPASQRAVTSPQTIDSAGAPVLSTPPSQKSSSSKPRSQYGPLSPDPNQWDMGF